MSKFLDTFLSFFLKRQQARADGATAQEANSTAAVAVALEEQAKKAAPVEKK